MASATPQVPGPVDLQRVICWLGHRGAALSENAASSLIEKPRAVAIAATVSQVGLE
jgi:hypothetical protein